MRPFERFFFIILKVDIISIKVHCCHGRLHDVSSTRLDCYINCGHTIIYDMTLSTGKKHMINFYARLHVNSVEMCDSL